LPEPRWIAGTSARREAQLSTNHAGSNRWSLPRTLLPDGDERPLWIVGESISEQKVSRAEVLPGRFTAPGLVDAHFHIALSSDHRPLGMDAALEKLRPLRDQGVLLIRDMGAPASLTLRLPDDPGLPRVLASGRQLAVDGGFFPDCYDPVAPDDLVAAGLAEIEAGATWVKVLMDWQTPDLTYPIETLRALVAAVHARGARVAAHTSWGGVALIAAAGVDSIEHGDRVDEPTLAVMAAEGIAWAPTTGPRHASLSELPRLLGRTDLEPERRKRIERWLPNLRVAIDNVAAMVPVAARLGVRLLASTDNTGTVADEVARFVQYGLSPTDALAAATTRSREFLGAPTLEDGAPADVVTFHNDPREDLRVLAEPAAIVLGGHRIR
jgi:imidazolonepropionase-like amidohydrolase